MLIFKRKYVPIRDLNNNRLTKEKGLMKNLSTLINKFKLL